jgi:hypothetical protein
MITLIWLIIGIVFEIKGKLSDFHEETGWVIGIMFTMLIDCLGIAVTCAIFPDVASYIFKN